MEVFHGHEEEDSILSRCHLFPTWSIQCNRNQNLRKLFCEYWQILKFTWKGGISKIAKKDIPHHNHLQPNNLATIYRQKCLCKNYKIKRSQKEKEEKKEPKKKRWWNLLQSKIKESCSKKHPGSWVDYSLDYRLRISSVTEEWLGSSPNYLWFRLVPSSKGSRRTLTHPCIR